MLKWVRHGIETRRRGGAAKASANAVRLPHGQRVYAIGDVHGRFDLLCGLISQIKDEEAVLDSANTTIVLLGDLIDRGPDSASVLQFVSAWNQSWAKLIALKGNHEDKLVRLLEGESVRLGDWLSMGGAATLRSYGIADETIRTARTGELIELARSEIVSDHQRWLRSLQYQWQCGGYLFVHAGIKPGIAVAEQQDRDLVAIRSEFLDSDADHGCLVIHGHSIEAVVEERANRIGIDTGAWRSGRLTAVRLDGAERSFITEVGSPGVGSQAAKDEFKFLSGPCPCDPPSRDVPAPPSQKVYSTSRKNVPRF